MEEEDGTFIICDIFDKREVYEIEKLFDKYFDFEKKEVITINVRHAMSLDKPRVEKIIKSITAYCFTNECNFLTKFLKRFFGYA